MTKTVKQVLERVRNKGFNDRCQQEKYADIDNQFISALSVDQALKELEALIRTEKLKLLAEVRERVIGEDLPPDVATDSGIGYSRQQFAINMGKAGQRTKLTQMEAEL